MLFQKLDFHEHEQGVDINITVVPLWTFDKKKLNSSKIVFFSCGNLAVNVSVWKYWAIKSTEVVKFETSEYWT